MSATFKTAPTILLAVTSHESLRLMTGFPEYLAGRGWDVHVVCSTPPLLGYSNGCTFHSVRMQRDPSLICDLKSLVKLWILVRRLRPDICISGTPKAGLLGMIVSFATRVPVRVYLLRGLRLETENGPRLWLLWVLERLTALLSTRVQSVSASLRSEYLKRHLCRSSKIVVLGAGSSNGVRVEQPRSEDFLRARESDRQTCFGFVGRISEDKGIEVLLEAFQIARQRRPEISLTLIGKEEPADFLNDLLTRSSALTRNVRWLGFMENAQECMSNFNAIVLPSYREGFPNVVLEAAARGVPAIAFDATGCKDAIVHKETGILTAIGDERELAGAILFAAENPSVMQELGKAARQRVQTRYRRQDVWRTAEAFYASELLGVNRHERSATTYGARRPTATLKSVVATWKTRRPR